MDDKQAAFAYSTQRSIQEAVAAINAGHRRGARAHHRLAALHVAQAASILRSH